MNKRKELFGIDIRSLALFRMGLASVLFGDLIVRAQDLVAHYTHLGVADIPPGFSSSPTFVLIMFIVLGVSSLALFFGYKTKVATLLSWALITWLQERNTLILQGGDDVLKLLLFWSIFLPLGAIWSVDQRIKRREYPTTILSFSTLAILLQVAFIYWFTALLKSDPIWREEGTAVWYALSIEQYSTPFGLYLLQFPTLLKIATFATLYLEAFGPFLAFFPIWTQSLRLTTALLFIAFHLVGLNLAMELAHFSYICSVAWLLFIPPKFWGKERVGTWKQSRWVQGAALCLIGFVFWWNAATLEKLPYPNPAFASLLHLEQSWTMFAPYPLQEDGWYVMPATLEDGTEIDLHNKGEPLSWEKPQLLSKTYCNDRWRSFLMNTLFDQNQEIYFSQLAKYLTKKWDAAHSAEKKIKRVEIIYMLKVNQWEKPLPLQKVKLWPRWP